MIKKDFIWWTGIIEEYTDPTANGRLKVRIFGYHGDALNDKTTIPPQDLPWATIMFAPNCPSSYAAPERGEWCVGFFMDGESAQFPVIMGILPGYRNRDRQ